MCHEYRRWCENLKKVTFRAKKNKIIGLCRKLGNVKYHVQKIAKYTDAEFNTWQREILKTHQEYEVDFEQINNTVQTQDDLIGDHLDDDDDYDDYNGDLDGDADGDEQMPEENAQHTTKSNASGGRGRSNDENAQHEIDADGDEQMQEKNAQHETASNASGGRGRSNEKNAHQHDEIESDTSGDSGRPHKKRPHLLKPQSNVEPSTNSHGSSHRSPFNLDDYLEEATKTFVPFDMDEYLDKTSVHDDTRIIDDGARQASTPVHTDVPSFINGSQSSALHPSGSPQLYKMGTRSRVKLKSLARETSKTSPSPKSSGNAATSTSNKIDNLGLGQQMEKEAVDLNIESSSVASVASTPQLPEKKDINPTKLFASINKNLGLFGKK